MQSKGLLVLVVLGAMLTLGPFATGCSVGRAAPAASTNDLANPPKTNPEIGAFRKIAFDACAKSTANERVPADAADACCACAVDELVKKVSADAMAQVSTSPEEELPTDMELDLTDAIVACSSISNRAGR